MLRATLLLSALCCAAGFMAPASPLRIAAVSQSSQLDISSEPLPALRCHTEPPAQPLRQWAVAWLPGVNRAAASSEPLMPAHLLAIPVQQLLTSFVLCVRSGSPRAEEGHEAPRALSPEKVAPV